MKSLFFDSEESEVLNFEEQEHRLVEFFGARAGILTIVMILAGTLLDYFYYPDLYYHFLAVRALSGALVAAILVVALGAKSHKSFRRINFLWVMLPQAMICYMIAWSGGAESIYFVGLNLAVAGLSIFWPVTIREAAFFSAWTFSLYLIACALGTPGTMFVRELGGNILFLLLFNFVLFAASVLMERWRRKTFEMQVRIRAQRDDVLAVNRQLAEAKLQILQSEKMASLGTLAAGLLHEMSNPVNYSKIALQLAKTDVEKGRASDAITNIEDAMLGTKRLASIISDLRHLAFHDPNETDGHLGVFELSQVVRVALRLTSHVCKGVTVHADPDTSVKVKGDGSSITSVLVNLIENAASSIKKAGRGSLGAITITVVPAKDGKWVTMSVRDNGTGVTPDVAERMFEPFFTTKPAQEGMGMGLAICYGVVRRHGSELRLTQSGDGICELSFDLEVVSDE